MDDKTKKIVENFNNIGDKTVYYTSRISPISAAVCLVSIGFAFLLNSRSKTIIGDIFLYFGCVCGMCSFFSLVIFGIVYGMQLTS